MDILPFAPCGRKATGTLAGGISAIPSSWAPAAAGIVLPSPEAEHPIQHTGTTAAGLPSHQASKPAFPCDVPDFVLADTSRSKAHVLRDPWTGKTKKGRPR